MFSYKKAFTILLLSMVSLSLAQANPNKKEQHKQMKQVKGKELPRGLQKKLHRTGELPPGWEKKLIVGNKLDPILLENAIEVDRYKYYNRNIEKSTREKIYQIEDKIVKVMAATNIILDVFEIE